MKIHDNLYTHPQFKGLLLARVNSLAAARQLGGALFEIGGVALEPTAAAAGKRGVMGFVGRDMRHLDIPDLNSGMKMILGSTSGSTPTYVEMGLVQTTEYRRKAGEPVVFVEGKTARVPLPNLEIHADAGDGSSRSRASSPVMGIVTSAEFGCISECVAQFNVAGTIPNSSLATLTATYPGICLGYLGMNISLGVISKILSGERDTLFDVESDLREFRDQALAELLARNDKTEFRVPVGVAFQPDGSAVFGLLTLVPVKKMAGGNDGGLTAPQVFSSKSISADPTWVKTVVDHGPGDSFYIPVTESHPRPSISLRLIPLAYTPGFGDIRSRLLLAETLPASMSSKDPLKACAPWEGGVSLAVAVGQMLKPFEETTRSQFMNSLQLAAGDVPGNELPVYDSDQRTGHFDYLISTKRFAGTVEALMTQVRWVYDRMEQLAK